MSNKAIWQNICVGCGTQVETHGADLPGQCPKCHGWRWLCHWLNPPEKEKIGKRWGQLTTPSVFAKLSQEIGDDIDIKNNGKTMAGGINTRKGILSQDNNAVVYAQRHNKGVYEPSPAKGRGRPRQVMPDDLILELASQGFSSRAIVEELAKRGSPGIGYKTIQRRLQASLL